MERGPTAWLYVDQEQDVALWGSPAALRRLAAGLVVAAEEADELVAPPRVRRSLDRASAGARSGHEPVRRVVAGP